MELLVVGRPVDSRSVLGGAERPSLNWTELCTRATKPPMSLSSGWLVCACSGNSSGSLTWNYTAIAGRRGREGSGRSGSALPSFPRRHTSSNRCVKKRTRRNLICAPRTRNPPIRASKGGGLVGSSFSVSLMKNHSGSGILCEDNDCFMNKGAGRCFWVWPQMLPVSLIFCVQ